MDSGAYDRPTRLVGSVGDPHMIVQTKEEIIESMLDHPEMWAELYLQFREQLESYQMMVVQMQHRLDLLTGEGDHG